VGEVDFPVPEAAGKAQRSIAERHRTVVLAVALISMIPVSLLMGKLISHPLLALGATFVSSYALVVGFVFVLRARFLAKASLTDFELRSTTRPVPHKAQGKVHALTTRGFTVADVVVVANSDGVVFTRPLALLGRLQGGQSATVSANGIQLVSLLADGRWLVTADSKVVTHQQLIIQPAGTGRVEDVVRIHNHGLDVLRDNGYALADQPTPFASALQIERFEQETLRSIKDAGTASPRSSTLLDSGCVLTNDMVSAWGSATALVPTSLAVPGP
jgi:hypothetical protein